MVSIDCLTPRLTGAEGRRAPIQAIKMAKPWPVLASALNRQLELGYLMIKTRKAQKVPNIDDLNAHDKDLNFA